MKILGSLVYLFCLIDARAVAKIIEYTDDLYGTEGEWVELTPNWAVEHEKFCLMA